MKALLVDDSRAMRTILRSIVARNGFEISGEAEHGRAALDLLADAGEVPDLILVDWNMPEMNGLELVQALRADPEFEDVAIVMVTSENEFENIASALEAGADEYVMKPFEEEELTTKLAQLGLLRDASGGRDVG